MDAAATQQEEAWISFRGRAAGPQDLGSGFTAKASPAGFLMSIRIVMPGTGRVQVEWSVERSCVLL